MKLVRSTKDFFIIELGVTRVCFSYDRIVAACVDDGKGHRRAWITRDRWSKTTTGHVNQFLSRYMFTRDEAIPVHQAQFDNIQAKP